MPEYSKAEANAILQDYTEFKKYAAPILGIVTEIKETQDKMVTAQAVADATEEQRYEKIAKAAVANFQKSNWYRAKQIGIILLVVIAMALLIIQAVDSNGKVDVKQLIETIKEIAK